MLFDGFTWFWDGLEGFGRVWEGLGGVGKGGEGWGGLRVTAVAGIRLSTWTVYKVDTLDGFLTGIVNRDVEFDLANRSGRSRAAGSCLETL